MAGGVSKAMRWKRWRRNWATAARLYCLWRWKERCRNAVDGGKGCIMGSAHQRLKDLHPELEVIGTNAEAVPHYLRKLYLS